jgi:hypothetical protein
MTSFGQVFAPEPPEHSVKVHCVAPLQYARHGEPPEQINSQPVTLVQFMSHGEPPEQFTSHAVTPSQST